MTDAIDPIEKHDRDLLAHGRDGSIAAAQIAGLVSGLLGALIWGLVTYFSHLIIGYFAIGLGLLVGFAVKVFGKGTGVIFGLTGGAYALMSCFLGMLFCLLFFGAASARIPFSQILLMADYGEIAAIYFQSFEVIDVVFYAIAFATAFKISMNPLGRDELDYVLASKGIDPDSLKARRPRNH